MASPRPERPPTTRRRRFALLAPVLAAAVLLPACGEDTSTLPDVPTSVVRVVVEPNPVIGIQNQLTGSVSVSFRITIDELAGLGGDVEFVSSTIYDPASGEQLVLNYYDAADLKVFVGSDRLEPGGTLVVPQSLSYTLPDLTKATNISVAVQVRDDRENLHFRSLLLPVE
jgi:hypothetical protein